LDHETSWTEVSDPVGKELGGDVMCLLQRDSQVPRRFFQRGTPGLVEVLVSLSKTQGERLMMFGVIKAEDITKIMPRTAG
jgi:hypothetical protein